MPVATPTERAIADVEKAIKAADAAQEKADKLQEKHDEAVGKANRANREVRWLANHPDLPEDFDLDEFRRSLEAPFSDGETTDDETTGDEVAAEGGFGEPDDAPPLEEEPVVEEKAPARARRGRPAAEPTIDDDDPFA